MSSQIIYRATVAGVSSLDVTLVIEPAHDGEAPIVMSTGKDAVIVNVPGAANAEDVGDVLRAFGALIEIRGAVRITIEPYRYPEQV